MSKKALQQRVVEEESSSSGPGTHPELNAILQDNINRSLPFNKEHLDVEDKRDNYPGFTLLRWSYESTSSESENLKTEDQKAVDLIHRDPPRAAPRYDLRKRIIDPDEDEDLKTSSTLRVVMDFLSKF